MSQIATIDETAPVLGVTAPGRGNLSSSRLDEHLRATVKRLKTLGVRPGSCIAGVLPDGPDAMTIALTAKLADAHFVSLARQASLEQYQRLLFQTDSKLLLLHAGAHPARDAARSLGIPIANVLRHFEAGVFTLEADIRIAEPSPLAWKSRARGVPLVLIAPGLAYRRLANRLDATNPVIGITAPSLEHLPLPHTIEHVAAECVRILRRYRPQGPYALAGWQADSLVALEMARLLEEEGEKVVFVAMLDAAALFSSGTSRFRAIRRACVSTAKLLRRKATLTHDVTAEAFRQYCPHPWFGKILHLGPSGLSRDSTLEWRHIAPHGFASYEAPDQMLAETNVQVVATILAAELALAKSSVA